ncbi:helix-turn-helix domain-containing protein [Patulibacter americanus]|uniref:helix-turn-helix domain-containing protein n=1 Tax=Patulibacter americanus TaxID=588672 RepID=UPI0003B717D0|nr:helix-turn-helix transcriptional regulator [Patulibacter americanus]
MAQNVELREFLRTRRGRLTPEDAGLPPGEGGRRVPGLRREELAALAGVSVDYYIRLEQGRSTSVSASVLDAIARALRLDDDERAHLFTLAKPAAPARRRAAPRPQRVRPGVRRLVEGLPTPAFVTGRRLDVLATNHLARALLCDFDALPPAQRNHARWVFLDPASRELYADWEAVARDNVAVLRMEAGRHPDDPELSALIGELTVKDEDFARWWAQHDVLRHGYGTKVYRHPVVGELTVDYEAFPVAGDPEQTLFVYTVAPGSRSAEALALLASWTAAPPAGSAAESDRGRAATDAGATREVSE